jgi:hypothetical protein
VPKPSEMNTLSSSNPATVNLDQTETEFASDAAGADSEDQETTKPLKVREANGHIYREIQLQGRRHRPRTGWFWRYGMLMEEEYKGKVVDEKRWVCQLCRGLSVYGARSSAHINSHLLREHKKVPPTNDEDESRATIPRQMPQLSVIELQRHAPQIVEARNISHSDKRTIINAKFEEALIAFIVCLNLSFQTVESYWFIALLTTISNLVGNTIRLPTSHNTISSWVKQSFKNKRVTVTKFLASSLSKIHLSFDNWSSRNGLAFTAIVAHFCSPSYLIESILIGFRELRGPHSGENIAEVVDEVLQDYSITPGQIGCFVLDNATNNDTCIEALGKTYKWAKSEVYSRRLRCFGHIINLVAQAFLFGSKSEVFAYTLDQIQHQVDSNVRIPIWKLRGPIGKLHYAVIYIRKTPQRRQEFAAGGPDCDSTKLVPRQDNATRWNSTFLMIMRALSLRQHIDYFCYHNRSIKDHDDGLTPEQILTPEDWLILTQLADGLKVFHTATITLEGYAKEAKFGAMWECIPVLEILSNNLIRLQNEYPLPTTFNSIEISKMNIPSEHLPGSNPATEFICESVNRAWMKFQEYYKITDRSIWYIAGLILNPEQKWHYLEYAWRDEKDWVLTSKRQFKDLWEQYKPVQPASEVTAMSSLPSRELQQKESTLTDELNAWRHASKKKVKVMDEYDEYLSTPPLEAGTVTNLVIWWGHHSGQWPNLSRLAFDALSIPAMSAECERSFSDAGRTITDERASLEPEAIEACSCVKNWLNKKL